MWFKSLRADIAAAKKNDPAARNKLEIFLTYSGVHALSHHRFANFLYRIHLRLLARMVSQCSKFFTGIEIHPAAKIYPGVFIDHGCGVVIGETAEIHAGTVIYQGATLGGTGKEHGKRHPTLMENVTVSAGAKILGGFVVGEGAKIGAGAVVLKEVPPHATVVGVPGRVVRIRGEKVCEPDLCQDKTDPYLDARKELCNLRTRVCELEKKLETLSAACASGLVFPAAEHRADFRTESGAELLSGKPKAENELKKPAQEEEEIAGTGTEAEGAGAPAPEKPARGEEPAQTPGMEREEKRE